MDGRSDSLTCSSYTGRDCGASFISWEAFASAVYLLLIMLKMECTPRQIN